MNKKCFNVSKSVLVKQLQKLLLCIWNHKNILNILDWTFLLRVMRSADSLILVSLVFLWTLILKSVSRENRFLMTTYPTPSSFTSSWLSISSWVAKWLIKKFKLISTNYPKNYSCNLTYHYVLYQSHALRIKWTMNKLFSHLSSKLTK